MKKRNPLNPIVRDLERRQREHDEAARIEAALDKAPEHLRTIMRVGLGALLGNDALLARAAHDVADKLEAPQKPPRGRKAAKR